MLDRIATAEPQLEPTPSPGALRTRRWREKKAEENETAGNPAPTEQNTNKFNGDSDDDAENPGPGRERRSPSETSPSGTEYNSNAGSYCGGRLNNSRQQQSNTNNCGLLRTLIQQTIFGIHVCFCQIIFYISASHALGHRRTRTSRRKLAQAHRRDAHHFKPSTRKVCARAGTQAHTNEPSKAQPSAQTRCPSFQTLDTKSLLRS
jgi:hypothetical protein